MSGLELSRPLVVFDLETTGTDPARDKIVEIALVRVDPDGGRTSLTRRINPGRPIPAEATAVHGIRDEDVAGAPAFRDYARELLDTLKDADLAGYNVRRFDVPLLDREFRESGLDLALAQRRIVDVMAIYHKKEPRDLSAAVRFYHYLAQTAATDAERIEHLLTDKPSFIAVRTIIGYPAPHLMNTGKAHGAALGDEEVAAVKKILGFDPDKNFEVRDEVIAHTRKLIDRGREAHQKWQAEFDAWSQREPDRKALLDRLLAQKMPDGWDADLPFWEPGSKPLATRAASGEVLNALGPKLPELWGGSADLAGSNNTTMKGEPSFIPPEHQTAMFPGNEFGRTLHFGIREHAMGGILNGIVLHGLTRPYGGTFLVFSDYMRPSVRLAAVTEMLRSLDEASIPLLRQRAGVETDAAVTREIETGLALVTLDGGDRASRLAAIAALAHRLRPEVRNRLAAMLETAGGKVPLPQDMSHLLAERDNA